jgi:hypothetical protein
MDLPLSAVGWGCGPKVPAALVLAVIALNAAWVADNILLPLSGWAQPTGLVTAFVIAQAAAVALFAKLQFMGLRRAAHVAVI